MTQPPFSGNDFFDQIDSVARNLTGNAFRLKRNDPTAPQKFTEFVAQGEQEFGQQPQRAAQPQSFTDFEQGGFQVNPAGDRRAGILAQQQAQSDATGKGLATSILDNTIGTVAPGIARVHGQALGMGLNAAEAVGRFGASSALDTIVDTPFIGDDIANQFDWLRQYADRRDAQYGIDKGGSFSDRVQRGLNIFSTPGSRALADPELRTSEALTQIPVYLPFVNEGRTPAFRVSGLDALEAGADVTNVVGGAGARTGLKGLAGQLDKPAQRSFREVMQEGGRSVAEEFAPVRRAADRISPIGRADAAFDGLDAESFARIKGAIEDELTIARQNSDNPNIKSITGNLNPLDEEDILKELEEGFTARRDQLITGSRREVTGEVNPNVDLIDEATGTEFSRQEATLRNFSSRIDEMQENIDSIQTRRAEIAPQQAIQPPVAARGAGDVPEPTFSGIGSGDHVQRTRADRIKALASGEIPKNFVEDLNIFSDRVYRESDASEALRVIGGGDTQPMSEIFTSNTPELALGQGTNKGVLIEYSTEGLKGRPDFTKPASRFSAEQSGTAEIVIKNRSTSSLKDNVLSITIDPAVADARELRTLMRSLAEPDELGVGDLGGRLRGQFDRETLPDGKIRFTPKQAAAQVPTTPATGTTAAARQVTPQQQAIIDDVGTGARAADDASLRAIEDATQVDPETLAASTTFTPESVTIGDDARRIFGTDQTIDFKLTKKERATNRLRETLPPDSSKPGSTIGPEADPIIDRLWEEHTKIGQRATNLGRTMSARLSPIIKKTFGLVDNDRIPSLAGVDPEILSAPTIQDVAARLPRYLDSMTPEQRALMEQLQVQFKPFGDALRASGDEFGTRLDIIEGGFYIPRGGAENGDQAIRLRGRGGRGAKPSSERTATFPSMAKALDDGWEYDQIGDAINGYVTSAGRRVADNFFTDTLKGVRNEAGERLGLTAKEVLVRDNPAIATRFANLTKASQKLKSLLKSKDSQLFKNLERLLADPEFDDIEAIRKAFSNSQRILRGELKGQNVAEVRKALTDLQKELGTFKVQYENAKKRILAGRGGGDEKRVGLSLFPQLDGITFPERMAARAEELVRQEDTGAFNSKSLRLVDDINRVWKSANATADNSAIGIQMLSAIYDNPIRQRRAVVASLKAWAHPAAYSDAVTQFNTRSTGAGRITSDDWAGRYGLAQVSGDANAQDVTSGLLEKGLGIPIVKKPLGSFFKRADAAFNTAGDMARLEIADDLLSEELASGRTLADMHSSGDLRRIADEASAATGYVEGKFDVANFVMFSARFFNARLKTLLRAARGLDIDAPLDLVPIVGSKLKRKVPKLNRYSRIQDRYARRMILRTLGWGTMMTVLLNEVQGNKTDFQFVKDGKFNPNFIRFRAFGKDRSMFGPLDTMLRIAVNAATGQAKSTVESFAQSPLITAGIDLFENEEFGGAPIRDPNGTKAEQSLQALQYLAGQLFPFALGEASESIGNIVEGAEEGNPIKAGIGTFDFLSDNVGMKASPLSSAELRELLLNTSDPAIRADIQRELDERKARFRRFDKPSSGIGGAVPFK